ncbi:amino acid adenylation domain-containing protein [Rhodoferax sp. 4810]|nr:amino acid adenylation domain-containing protein [Rhodoferax jenense]
MVLQTLQAPHAGLFFQQLAVSVNDLDVPAFTTAWQQIITRHAILRTAFQWQDDTYLMQVVYHHADLQITQLDWRELSELTQRQQLKTLLLQDRRRGFILTEPPLLRLLLIQHDARRWTVIKSHHHALFDGWSGGLLQRDVQRHYIAIRQQRSLQLPPPPSFGEYAQWLTAQDFTPIEQFWRQQFSGFISPTPLPGLIKRTATAHPAQPFISQELVLPAALTMAIQSLAQQLHLTINTVLQAAWALLLQLWSGERDLVFGATFSGRSVNYPDLTEMIGLLINALPVRVQLNWQESVADWLSALHSQLLTVQTYEHTPPAQIQTWSELPANVPLFNTLVTFNSQALNGGAPAIDNVNQANAPLSFTSIPLSLMVFETPAALRLTLTAHTQYYGAEMLMRLLQQVQWFLTVLTTHSTQQLGKLPLMSAAEAAVIITQWNHAQVDYPRQLGLHQVFELAAARTPNAIAVIDNDGELTFAALNQQANQLAYYLRALGVTADALVGLAIERSRAAVIGLLAILKAGGGYVPLDPDYPAPRLAFMLADAGVHWLLTQTALTALHRELNLTQSAVQVIQFDQDAHLWADAPADNLPPDTNNYAERVAVVIYTSGSTGQPKGALLPHRVAVNRLFIEPEPLRPNEVLAAKTSFNFIDSIWELFYAWHWNCPTRLIDQTTARDPVLLIKTLAAAGVTRLVLVPSLLRSLLDTDAAIAQHLPHLQQWICSGEPLPADLSERFAAQLPDRLLVNVYGTSETWDVTRYAALGRNCEHPAPLGRPFANCQIYVLDSAGRSVPIGVAGEVVIGGDGVTLGYLGHPGLTAERFIPDPFQPQRGTACYRSGDRARWRPDGQLELLGRTDQQVKIRGYRVELGEIEAVLRRHPTIAQAAVVATAQQQLVAFVVYAADPSASADAPPNPLPVLEFLQQQLPAYLVPARLIPLERLPLTPSGKLDRQALPDPNTDFTERQHQSATDTAPRSPTTATEQRVAEIWSTVLRQPHLNVDDRFTHLGGHSLLATQVMTRLRDQFQLQIPLAVILDDGTVASVAAWLDSHRDDPHFAADADLPLLATELVTTDASGEIRAPQSFGQQRLWFLAQLAPGSPLYTTLIPINLTGQFDELALREAITALVQRHETLRTVFGLDDNAEPVQRILPELPPPLQLLDFTHVARVQHRAALQRLRLQIMAQPFDLATGPLLRITAALLEPTHQLLLVALHHIITDGWSLAILRRELLQFYTAARRGQVAQLPPLPLQYRDYAIWQRQLLHGESRQQLLDYWRQKLAGVVPLTLPTDHPRTATPPNGSARVALNLDTALTQRLHTLGQLEQATLFMVLLAAFQWLLRCYSGQTDVVVGTPVANRNRAELEGLIGLFVNTLALRSDLSGAPSFRHLLQQVKQTCLDAYAHQDLPFEQLVDELAPQRDLHAQPLVQVLLVLQTLPHGGGSGAGAGSALPAAVLPHPDPLALGEGESEMSGAAGAAIYFDLTLTLTETPHGLTGDLRYSPHLFERSTMQRLVNHWLTLLVTITQQPEVPLAPTSLISAAEREQLHQFSRGQVNEATFAALAAEPPACIHQLIAEQAQVQPDHAALAWGADQQLSYAQLDQCATSLAAQLLERGLQPEQVVGMFLERGAAAIVTILAIFKAGGVYLPLDPNLPSERLAWLLDDARPAVIVTSDAVRDQLPEVTAAVISLPADWVALPLPAGEGWGEGEMPATATALSNHVNPHQLAYLIYTSGSTGRPKGVMVEHHSLTRVIRAQIPRFRLTSDQRVLATIALSFDASLGEICRTLGAGATLYLAPREALLPGAGLIHLLRDQRITTATLVPAVLAACPNDVELPELTTISVGGESLSIELAQRWGRGRRLLNGYGPTETTIGATLAWDWSLDKKPPLGRPLPGVIAQVLNENQQLLPLGLIGELYLGGAHLARGYWQQPELTAQRFIPDPFNSEPAARLYRTGDLVRWLNDGQLEFCGRTDEQIKIRGHRVEPGEVAAVLNEHPAIAQAIVLAWQPPAANSASLAAFIVLMNPTDAPPNYHQFLAPRLPDYLIPQRFINLPALPRTANDKLDRAALLNQLATTPIEYAAANYVEPRTEVEQTLAKIWALVLGIEQVGIHDNFFELGGDSILSIKMLVRANEAGLQLTPRDVYRLQTIAEQAAYAVQQMPS